MSAATARPYARALFDAAGSDAPRIADELDAFAALSIDALSEWNQLTAPGIASATRKTVVDRLLSDGHILLRNMLKVLIDNGRLEETSDIAIAFRELVKIQQGELDVHVTTAIDLSNELRTKLEQRLSTSTGKQVQLHTSTDPSIIGGLIVRHGDTLIDTSLKGRLEQLRLELSRTTNRPTSASAS